MKENTYYFPHDYNAHKDPKCSALISDFGLTGYGIYWAIIELLHEQGGKIQKFPKLYDGLSFQFKMKKDELITLIEALLHDYELLQDDDKFIWSNRVLRNLQEKKDKYAIKAEAGRIGGIKSGKIRKKLSEMKQNEALLEANEQKESKGKESKGNIYNIPPTLENVTKYCLERKNNVDTNKWFNFYSAKGWMIGKNKMKDWRAAVRTWEEKKQKDYSTISDFSLMEEKIKIQNDRKKGINNDNPELLKELTKRFS